MQNNSNEGLPVAMGPPMAIDEEPDFDLIANLDHLKSALTRQRAITMAHRYRPNSLGGVESPITCYAA